MATIFIVRPFARAGRASRIHGTPAAALRAAYRYADEDDARYVVEEADHQDAKATRVHLAVPGLKWEEMERLADMHCSIKEEGRCLPCGARVLLKERGR